MNKSHREDLNWLVNDFAHRMLDVAHAAVVSADGVPLALSEYIPEESVEQFAAIVAGLSSLMSGTDRIMKAGGAVKALVAMTDGLLLVMMISDGSSLAVLAAPDCDTELLTYEMTLLVEAVGEALTPALRVTGY